jgi:hypothetical protein
MPEHSEKKQQMEEGRADRAIVEKEVSSVIAATRIVRHLSSLKSAFTYGAPHRCRDHTLEAGDNRRGQKSRIHRDHEGHAWNLFTRVFVP